MSLLPATGAFSRLSLVLALLLSLSLPALVVAGDPQSYPPPMQPVTYTFTSKNQTGPIASTWPYGSPCQGGLGAFELLGPG